MTLTEFLLARIAEDEENAHRVHDRYSDAFNEPDLMGVDCSCGQPERVLAECAAKRAIVEWLTGREQVYIPTCSSDLMDPKPEEFVPGGPIAKPVEFHALRYLAAVYADHPDYDEAWRITQPVH